jgi:MinD-like ATPase involved in chromosome partitioning or flagellar assembly
MALVSLCSAKGAPGVTTTALLTAALWPRPVLLADCDASGGDVALRLPSESGRPVDPERGLLSLTPLARRGLTADTVLGHRQVVAGGTEILAGLATPEQARAVGPLWSVFAGAFETLPGVDVLADCGRVGSDPVVLPVLARSALVVFVVRPTVPGVVHTRERLRLLETVLRPHGVGPRVGVLVVAPAGDTREVEGVYASIRADLPWVETLGHLAEDPKGAGLFEGHELTRPDRTMLVRSARSVVGRLAGSVAPSLGVPA